MYRKGITASLAFAAFMLALLLTAGCGGEPSQSATESTGMQPQRTDEEVEADYEKTVADFYIEQDEEKKFQIWFDFLERNPDSGYSMGALNYLAKGYYLGSKDDPTGAIDFVQEHAKRMSGENAADAKILLIDLYGSAGNVDKLREMAGGMAADGTLNFIARLAFANAATSTKAWDLAIEHAKAAVEAATPEAIRAETDSGELNDGDLKDMVINRKSKALTALAHAQLESGDVDAAIVSFKAAEEYVSFNYVGVPNNSDINAEWAKALISKGDYDAAMRRIAPDAIMLGDEKAMEIFKEAYEKSGGAKAGFDAAVQNMRAELARPVQPFEAYTYEGNKVAWSDLKGRVTYLCFWFPT